MGSGPGWEECPYNKETWVVAKMLMLPEPPKRVDRIFSMDRVEDMKVIKRGLFTEREFSKVMNARKVPFITSEHNRKIKHCQSFPYKEIVRKFKVPYFTNTICYMIAYALYSGVTNIDVYGVSQMGAHEYVLEKGGVEFWLGLAMGFGVEVNVYGHTMLFKGHGNEYPYGYHKTSKELMS